MEARQKRIDNAVCGIAGAFHAAMAMMGLGWQQNNPHFVTVGAAGTLLCAIPYAAALTGRIKMEQFRREAALIGSSVMFLAAFSGAAMRARAESPPETPAHPLKISGLKPRADSGYSPAILFKKGL
jgi:hypothetical protein